MIHESFKPFGVISIVGIWIAVTFVLTKWGTKRSLSISQHIGAHKLSYGVCAVLYTIFLSLFYLYATMWLSPNFHLPDIATITIAVGTVALIIAGWFPDRMRGDWITQVHRLFAYLMAVSLIIFLCFLVNSSYIGSVPKVICFTVLFILLAITLLFALSKKSKSAYLYYQIAYIASFHVAILSATYIK